MYEPFLSAQSELCPSLLSSLVSHLPFTITISILLCYVSPTNQPTNQSIRKSSSTSSKQAKQSRVYISISSTMIPNPRSRISSEIPSKQSISYYAFIDSFLHPGINSFPPHRRRAPSPKSHPVIIFRHHNIFPSSLYPFLRSTKKHCSDCI